MNEEEFVNLKDKNNKTKKQKRNKLIVIIIFIALLSILGLHLFLTSPIDIETVKDSVVMIKVYDKNNNEISTGSGFCTYKTNYIITNYHVIEGAYKIKILTDDNREYSIRDILIFNQKNDLAILSGDFELTPIKIGNVNNLKAGENVTAIGSPKGQLNTVSTGVISNADNNYQIRITAPISPGSSGGVLLNAQNKVIGITYATFDSLDSQNINYAISVEYLNDMNNSLNNKSYSQITLDNYDKYLDDLVASGKGHLYREKHYSIDSINTWYKITDTFCRFDYDIKKYITDYYEIYKDFSDEDKSKAAQLHKTIGQTVFNSSNICENIKTWNITEFFMNLGILNDYEYSVIATDIGRYNNNGEMFNRVEKYPLEAAQKALILYLIGGYEWTDIHKDNKEDIFDYFDQKGYETKDFGAILEILGYEVEYKSDGTLTAWW